MKVEIKYIPKDDQYYAEVWDGPDLIDYANFVCGSLGECFESIIKFRMKVGLEYYKDTL